MRAPEWNRSQKRIGVDAVPLAASCRLLCSQVRISGFKLSVDGLSKSPPLFPKTVAGRVKLGTDLMIVANETSECFLLKLMQIEV
jgi:hypothetical protein